MSRRRRTTLIVKLALGLLPTVLGGCLDEPPYRCQSNDVCFYKGFMGQCDLNAGTCVYMSADCQGIMSIEGWVNAKGQCVPAPANSVSTSSSTSTTTAGPSSDASTTGKPNSTTDPSSGTESASGFDDGSSDSGETLGSSSGDGDSSSGSTNPCTGADTNVTSQGEVTASTTFNGFPETYSVDGDPTTSWFSTGPEGGGGPSVYAWATDAELCISRLEVDDNHLHDNVSYRTGYGFDSAIVRVLYGPTVIFEETVQLPGTPDGPFVVDTGGLVGTRVLLELNGHENEECGGFAELRVFGGPS